MIQKFFFKVHFMGSVPHENQGRGLCHGVKNRHLSVNAFVSWHQEWMMTKILEARCPFWDPWESGPYQPPSWYFKTAILSIMTSFSNACHVVQTKAAFSCSFSTGPRILYLALLVINPILILRLDRDYAVISTIWREDNAIRSSFLPLLRRVAVITTEASAPLWTGR